MNINKMIIELVFLKLCFINTVYLVNMHDFPTPEFPIKRSLIWYSLKLKI